MLSKDFTYTAILNAVHDNKKKVKTIIRHRKVAINYDVWKKTMLNAVFCNTQSKRFSHWWLNMACWRCPEEHICKLLWHFAELLTHVGHVFSITCIFPYFFDNLNLKTRIPIELWNFNCKEWTSCNHLNSAVGLRWLTLTKRKSKSQFSHLRNELRSKMEACPITTCLLTRCEHVEFKQR